MPAPTPAQRLKVRVEGGHGAGVLRLRVEHKLAHLAVPPARVTVSPAVADFQRRAGRADGDAHRVSGRLAAVQKNAPTTKTPLLPLGRSLSVIHLTLELAVQPHGDRRRLGAVVR